MHVFMLLMRGRIWPGAGVPVDTPTPVDCHCTRPVMTIQSVQ